MNANCTNFIAFASSLLACLPAVQYCKANSNAVVCAKRDQFSYESHLPLSWLSFVATLQVSCATNFVELISTFFGLDCNA